MKRSVLPMLACPRCHGPLSCEGPQADPIVEGGLTCKSCERSYPIRDGIPRFIELKDLSGLDRRFAGLYDRFAWAYRAFSLLAFSFIGMREEEGRREITDRLEPHGGPILEVSMGPGSNLPFVVHRPDVSEVFGLDISIGQLEQCRRYAARKGFPVHLFLGNGEELPFADGSFAGVFHVGGINFFENPRRAIEEMIRVARRGTRILIADETEKGARAYERLLPGFKKSFQGQRGTIVPPVDLVPAEMLETQVFDVWKGWLYCLEFRKP